MGSLTLDFKVGLPRYSGFKDLQFFKLFSILDFVFMAFRFLVYGEKSEVLVGFFGFWGLMLQLVLQVRVLYLWVLRLVLSSLRFWLNSLQVFCG